MAWVGGICGDRTTYPRPNLSAHWNTATLGGGDVMVSWSPCLHGAAQRDHCTRLCDHCKALKVQYVAVECLARTFALTNLIATDVEMGGACPGFRRCMLRTGIPQPRSCRLAEICRLPVSGAARPLVLPHVSRHDCTQRQRRGGVSSAGRPGCDTVRLEAPTKAPMWQQRPEVAGAGAARF